MLHVTALDRWAQTGTGWLHRTSPLAKWGLLAAAVLVAILSRELAPLVIAYALLALAIVSAGAPIKALMIGSLLPVPLVGLFAVSQWDGRWEHVAAIVAKGMVTALAGLTVAATTPYPDLLAPATRVLPGPIADSLVMTYRALFILAAQVESLVMTLRVRSGLSVRLPEGALPWPARGMTWRRRLEIAGSTSALTLLRGIDLSTRLYDVMRLRGYAGRMAPARSLAPVAGDWRAAVLAVAMVMPAALVRVRGVAW